LVRSDGSLMGDDIIFAKIFDLDDRMGHLLESVGDLLL
jgi:protein involved in temperature-dependent protein secretion